MSNPVVDLFAFVAHVSFRIRASGLRSFAHMTTNGANCFMAIPAQSLNTTAQCEAVGLLAIKIVGVVWSARSRCETLSGLGLMRLISRRSERPSFVSQLSACSNKFCKRLR